MLHTIVGLVIASIMVCNFHWRGSETEAGKFFIREYYFEPNKDNQASTCNKREEVEDTNTR